MRASVKSAAFGGYRSIGLFAGRAAVAAGLRASQPATATVSVEGGPSMSISSLDKGSQKASPVSAVQKPWWEEVEEIVALESLDPAPRLVFGPVPTLEEAKEATSNLADTLNEMHPSLILSHSSTEVPHASFMLEAPVVGSSIPRHVAQTFVSLQRSPEFRHVVASIAADKNVWDAVMNNPEVTEFCKTHVSRIVFPPPESSRFATEVLMADEDCKSSPLKDFIHRAKDKMVEVVINISTFIQDYFDRSKTGNTFMHDLFDPSKTGSEKDKSFVNSTFGSSLMALAISTILMIVFKRAHPGIIFILTRYK